VPPLPPTSVMKPLALNSYTFNSDSDEDNNKVPRGSI